MLKSILCYFFHIYKNVFKNAIDKIYHTWYNIFERQKAATQIEKEEEYYEELNCSRVRRLFQKNENYPEEETTYVALTGRKGRRSYASSCVIFVYTLLKQMKWDTW